MAASCLACAYSSKLAAAKATPDHAVINGRERERKKVLCNKEYREDNRKKDQKYSMTVYRKLSHWIMELNLKNSSFNYTVSSSDNTL